MSTDDPEIRDLTPAHFRTLRECAGLTQQDVAQHAGVQDRSARRWESTHVAPLEVQEWVRDCWREVRDTARAVTERRDEDGEVTLTRAATGWEYGEYWTPGMDAAVTRLALALLELDGTEVTVE